MRVTKHDLVEALEVARNALDQNVTMCRRAASAGVQNAGPLATVTQQALSEVTQTLARWHAHKPTRRIRHGELPTVTGTPDEGVGG